MLSVYTYVRYSAVARRFWLNFEVAGAFVPSDRRQIVGYGVILGLQTILYKKWLLAWLLTLHRIACSRTSVKILFKGLNGSTT